MIRPFSHPVRCVLALVSGVVYALAFPPVGWGWLVVPATVGLLLLLRGQQGTRARALGFIFGFTAFSVSISWLFGMFGGVAIALWCVLASFFALFAEMQSRASLRGISGYQMVFFTVLNWSGWEFIRAELFPLKFSWMTPGLAVGPNPLLPWIGVYGVGFILIILAGFIALKMWKPALVMILPCVVMLLPLADLTPEEGDPRAVRVGGLQLESVSLTEYLRGTEQLPEEIQYVLWPEYAVPYDLRANQRDWDLVQKLCKDRRISLTLGTQSRPGNGDEWRNIALTLDPTGALGEHTKVHTVHFFDDGIPGTTTHPVLTQHGKVGTPICFDCDFEGVVRGMTAKGAELLMVPVMDAEAWTARQHDQHAALFQIRACENGRWMFVCGTSGVSQVIAPNGRVQTLREALTQGPITGIMRRESGLTFYTRFGWLTPWIVLALAAVCWLFLLLPRRWFDRVR